MIYSWSVVLIQRCCVNIGRGVSCTFWGFQILFWRCCMSFFIAGKISTFISLCPYDVLNGICTKPHRTEDRGALYNVRTSNECLWFLFRTTFLDHVVKWWFLITVKILYFCFINHACRAITVLTIFQARFIIQISFFLHRFWWLLWSLTSVP